MMRLFLIVFYLHIVINNLGIFIPFHVFLTLPFSCGTSVVIAPSALVGVYLQIRHHNYVGHKRHYLGEEVMCNWE